MAKIHPIVFRTISTEISCNVTQSHLKIKDNAFVPGTTEDNNVVAQTNN